MMVYFVKFVGYNDQYRCESKEAVLELVKKHLDNDVSCDLIIKIRSDRHA